MNSLADQRLLVISPIRNEAHHLERVAHAMAAQTRPPDTWVVVDDGSTDETPAILSRLAPQIGFLRIGPMAPPATSGAVKDRLATAAAPRAFNRGLGSVDWKSFTHIAKIDGDIELPRDYFDAVLRRFSQDASLGIAGGIRTERTDDGWTLERPPLGYHVPGALKCYAIECLEKIGGVQERLAWDTIDELYARMEGFRTQAFPDLVAVHHRPWGSADGSLRGRARHGRCAYIVHYPLTWVAARAFKHQPVRPRILSALCFVGGYALAALQHTDRVEDPEFRTFMRRELRVRALHLVGARRAAVPMTPAPQAANRATVERNG